MASGRFRVRSCRCASAAAPYRRHLEPLRCAALSERTSSRAIVLAATAGSPEPILNTTAQPRAGNVRDPLDDDFALMSHVSARVAFPPGLIGRGVELSLRPGNESGWIIEEKDFGVPEPCGPERFTPE